MARPSASGGVGGAVIGFVPDVHVIVVHYRSGGSLQRCVASALGQEGVAADVTVVECGDDGSTQSLPVGVHVLRPGRNLGYAGGNNYAVSRLAQDDVPILLINPDVALSDPHAVRVLLRELQEAPVIGAVAPLLRRPDGLLEYTGSSWDHKRGVAVHTGGGAMATQERESIGLPWLNGACLLIKRAAWHEVGPFDERYFLYFEEVDWCLRAKAAGFLLKLVPVEVQHGGSESFAGSSKGARYAVRNRLLLARSHARGGSWRWTWLRGCLRLVLRASGQRRSVLLGARDALTGRWGPVPEDASHGLRRVA